MSPFQLVAAPTRTLELYFCANPGVEPYEELLLESPHRLGVLPTSTLTPAIYSSKLEASRKPYLVFHSQFIVADVVPLEQSRLKEERSMQVDRAYSQIKQSRNYADPNRRSFVKLLRHSQLDFAQDTALDSDS